MAARFATGKSREEVALELLKLVSMHEDKDVEVVGSGADRTYILTTYYRCLQATIVDPATDPSTDSHEPVT